ncbi:MAG: HAMP domain-containing histidine kinase [Bacteriovoracaceae bacterium]|nr:HAMP domain-containing histidine kinase [Bacteriovoracaceae bacterium]
MNLFPKKLVIISIALSIIQASLYFYTIHISRKADQLVQVFYLPMMETNSICIRLNKLINAHIETLIQKYTAENYEKVQLDIFALDTAIQSLNDLLKEDPHNLGLPVVQRQELFKIENSILDFTKKKNLSAAAKLFNSNEYIEANNNFTETIENLTEHFYLLREKKLEEHNRFLQAFFFASIALLVLIGNSWIRIYSAYRRNYNNMKEAEKELEEERLKSFQSSKLVAIGELASGIAHEINNPLTVIAGTVDKLKKLQERSTLDEKTLFENVERVQSTVKRITKIINSLRKLSRDTHADEIEMVDSNLLLEDSLEIMEKKCMHHAIAFTVENHAPNIKIPCRSLEIQQVVINLVNNAFDAICKDPGAWVRIQFTHDLNFFYLSVIDSGPGIPKEIQDKIMTPFFTTKEVGTGTGLGLSLSKKLINHHKGELYLDTSSPNTKFVVKLPLHYTDDKKAA